MDLPAFCQTLSIPKIQVHMKTSHQSKNCKYRTFEKYNNAFLKYKQKINPVYACANYLIHSFISFYLVIFELCIKSMAVKGMQTRMTPMATSFH